MTLLRDADPSGVIVSFGYLLAVAACAREAGRARSPRSRSIWSLTAALLVFLLIEQQGDLHSWALREGSDLLESHGIWVQSPPVLIASAGVLLLTGFASAWLTMTAIRAGWPPGAMATCGLLLIVVHGASRGAGFLHLPMADWTVWGNPAPLQAVEAAGLALVIIGILRGAGSPPSASPAWRRLTDASHHARVATQPGDQSAPTASI